jgi:hypothetical protein
MVPILFIVKKKWGLERGLGVTHWPSKCLSGVWVPSSWPMSPYIHLSSLLFFSPHPQAYSVYDEEIGYCQGQSFLAAVLLLHVSNYLTMTFTLLIFSLLLNAQKCQKC